MTDKEKITCLACGKEVNNDDLYCRHCGSEVKASPDFTEDVGAEEYPELDLGEEGYSKTAEELESELSELDYEPKKKSVFLFPVLVIVLALAMIIGGIYILSNTDDDPAAADEPLEIPDAVQEDEQEDEQPDEVDPDNQETTEPADPDEDLSDNEIEGDIPPDHDLLEEAMEQWLTERVNDPDVILLHTDELEDFDQFFETYDLEEDNVIVYMVESTEDEFATALMGQPFSEWSIKAIFIWRDGQWDFLREVTVG